nr:hypothetical protein [uncultured archaeon]
MNEDLSIEEFRSKMYSIMKMLPPNYYIGGFIDAREKYESSGKTENELEFIIKEMEKLPAEYSTMIKKEAEKFSEKKENKNCEATIKIERLYCAETIVLSA